MKKIKSYARTVSRTLSNAQKEILNNCLPKYKINLEKLIEFKNLNIEIGFGMGDFLYKLALNNPSKIFWGMDVYTNGIVNLVRRAEESKLSNLFISNIDVSLVLNKLPDAIVDNFYILFPDPWPKAKHKKRRLVNSNLINILTHKLKSKGELLFVTDIESYYQEVKNTIQNQHLLKFCKHDSILTKYANDYMTKYHKKALINSREINIILASKV